MFLKRAKMSLTFRKIAVMLVIVLILLATTDCEAKRKRSKKVQEKSQTAQRKTPVAKELELRETNPPNFVRLLIMRLIYGLAAQMNLEERVAGWFNGAFAPPNADYAEYGFGDELGDFGAGDFFDAK